MATHERKPLAFISTSLREEDKPFVDLVEKITRENGFEPYGTVGKYSAAPMPIWDHIVENIPKADCVIMAATPRYFQEDIHNRGITSCASYGAALFVGSAIMGVLYDVSILYLMLFSVIVELASFPLLFSVLRKIGHTT